MGLEELIYLLVNATRKGQRSNCKTDGPIGFQDWIRMVSALRVDIYEPYILVCK